MKKQLIFSLITILISCSIAIGYVEFKKNKVAFIRTEYLIQKYKGYQDLEKKILLERNRYPNSNMSDTLAQKASAEILNSNQTLVQGVLNQINDFIKKYSEDHGYTFVFGTTNDGTLLFGNKGVDITEDVLEELNTEYSGK
jgi:Skp family chaperone for outer membrane proteins